MQVRYLVGVRVCHGLQGVCAIGAGQVPGVWGGEEGYLQYFSTLFICAPAGMANRAGYSRNHQKSTPHPQIMYNLFPTLLLDRKLSGTPETT